MGAGAARRRRGVVRRVRRRVVMRMSLVVVLSCGLGLLCGLCAIGWLSVRVRVCVDMWV